MERKLEESKLQESQHYSNTHIAAKEPHSETLLDEQEKGADEGQKANEYSASPIKVEEKKHIGGGSQNDTQCKIEPTGASQNLETEQ